MDYDEQVRLEAEANQFHLSLFGFPAKPSVVNLYKSAHRFYLQKEQNVSQVDVRKIVEHTLDAEAIEFALRKRLGPNLLTQKLHLLVYLCESQSDYFSVFVNKKRTIFTAFAIMKWEILRSIFQLLKGNYLIRRHKIV